MRIDLMPLCWAAGFLVGVPCVLGLVALLSPHHDEVYGSVQQEAATPSSTQVAATPSPMPVAVPSSTPVPETIWTKEELQAYFHPTPHKEPSPVKQKTNGAIVDNKEDADATHIYFGPTSDRDLRTLADMKGDYDQNPKAYIQGWRDGWKWALKQSEFSGEEAMEKKLYGDIENEPGETKSLGFQAAMELLRDRGENKANAELKPALAGSVDELDKPGQKPYQWTLRYIEQAAGVGVGELIAPNTTFGPYPSTYDKQRCWLCKVAYHVPGDDRAHCAIVYEEPVIGPEHVIGCVIDF